MNCVGCGSEIENESFKRGKGGWPYHNKCFETKCARCEHKIEKGSMHTISPITGDAYHVECFAKWRAYLTGAVFVIAQVEGGFVVLIVPRGQSYEDKPVPVTSATSFGQPIYWIDRAKIGKKAIEFCSCAVPKPGRGKHSKFTCKTCDRSVRKVEISDELRVFDTEDDAKHAAWTIGHYIMDLGSLMFAWCDRPSEPCSNFR